MVLNNLTQKESNDIPELLALMNSMSQDLITMTEDWDSFFPNREKRADQIEDVQKVIGGLAEKIQGKIDKKAIAVIEPPRFGKTFEMVLLTKLMLNQNIPSIIGMRNPTTIHGPDNALPLFREIFGEENIGVVDAQHSDFSRPITFITSSSLSKKFTQFPQYEKVNIMLDECDTFQTDMRQRALDRLIDSNTSFVSAYSATTLLNKRDIKQWAHIVVERSIIETIEKGYAKQIEGFYYKGNITITDDRIKDDVLDYDALSHVEQQWLIDSAYQIYDSNRNKKTLIYCNNIRQCEDTHKMFVQNGVNAAYVSYRTPGPQRAEIEESYVNGDLQVLISPRIYGRGFSEKGVTQLLIFAKITGSVTEAYHTLVRGNGKHEEYKTLYLYQLLPSTISTRKFLPVLMHHCFHIDVNDLEYWMTKSHKDTITELPSIRFIQPEQDTDGKTGKRKQNIYNNNLEYKNEPLQYASQDEISQILSIPDKSFKIDQYIKDNFNSIVDSFFVDNPGVRLFQIDLKTYGDRDITIKIDDQDEKISFKRFLSSVFYLVSGGNRSEAFLGGNAQKTLAMLQTWYVSKEMPIYNTLIDTLKTRGVIHKVSPLRDEYIENYALEIFSLSKPPRIPHSSAAIGMNGTTVAE